MMVDEPPLATKGSAGDCVARAIAIATGKPYREVYEALWAGLRHKAEHGRGHVANASGEAAALIAGMQTGPRVVHTAPALTSSLPSRRAPERSLAFWVHSSVQPDIPMPRSGLRTWEPSIGLGSKPAIFLTHTCLGRRSLTCQSRLLRS